MELQGMSDETYRKILNEVNDIRYLIVRSGQMATKTKTEEVLMARYNCDRGCAHEFVNLAESANKQDFKIGKIAIWRAARPEPRPEDWPELCGCKGGYLPDGLPGTVLTNCA